MEARRDSSTTNGASPQQQRRLHIVFDFDCTLSAWDSCKWLVKYYDVFRGRIPPDIKDAYKAPSVPYDEFMNGVFERFGRDGKSVGDLARHMRRLPLIDGFPELLRDLLRRQIEHAGSGGAPPPPIVRILSDSFVPLIEWSLEGNGIDAEAVTRVGRRPSNSGPLIDVDGRADDDSIGLHLTAHHCAIRQLADAEKPLSILRAQPLMRQSECQSCPTRLCKGIVMRELLAKADVDTTFVYLGDGRNDHCALKQLRRQDVGMPKCDSHLERLVGAAPRAQLKCKVLVWENGHQVTQLLKAQGLF